MAKFELGDYVIGKFEIRGRVKTRYGKVTVNDLPLGHITLKSESGDSNMFEEEFCKRLPRPCAAITTPVASVQSLL